MQLSTFPKVFTKLANMKSSLANNEELPQKPSKIASFIVRREMSSAHLVLFAVLTTTVKLYFKQEWYLYPNVIFDKHFKYQH